MAWTIEYSEKSRKTLRKFDRQVARRVLDYMDHRVAVGDPRGLGKPLHASLEDYWSYRVGDYRLICEIKDRTLVVLVVEIGHRSDVYR
ncbi:MAG: type II toxin-antitoxin system RelE family toxin [Mesorhizobium sp.]